MKTVFWQIYWAVLRSSRNPNGSIKRSDFTNLSSITPTKVDTPSCSARELALAAARLDAHLYWSISSRLDEEPTLAEQDTKQPDGGSAHSKVGESIFTVGEMTDIQEQSALGELNGSVTTDQSETEA